MHRAATYGSLLDVLRGVTWPARRRVAAGAAGTHRSSLRGLAAEFTEYRPYRQGDDPRRMDWKLLARTDRVYFRLSDDHVSLTTLIAVDASASMAFPDGARSKWNVARLLAVGLAAVAHASGDPVGLVIAAAPPVVLPARSRRGVLAELIRVLECTRPDGRVALAPLVGDPRQAPRLVVISDFLGDTEALRTAVAHGLVGGREVYAVHVVAEEELEPAGGILAVDPEDRAVSRALVAETLDGYRDRFAAWRRGLHDDLRRAGATVTEVVSSEPAARAVRRIVRLAS